MRYLLLIYTREQEDGLATPAEREATMSAYFAFTNEIQEAGVMLGGEALQSTVTATTVRNRDGQTLIIDGPFAETKEQLGGYYMLECENLDQAIEYAAKIPVTANGCVEVRPVFEFE